ncbi:hypothetical protein IEO21_09886 [Rhodonia placenta]|uniref:Uncharacterized protein n=1 Tax=Rhodonia placenta TaxID=104341 RepID=A0A8H7NTK0_9APHY|nr:hypothetical protein IEO21_09886 [Postia placenta]
MSLRDSAITLMYTSAPFVDRPIINGVWNHSSLDCVRRWSACQSNLKTTRKTRTDDTGNAIIMGMVVLETASAICGPWSRNQLTALPSYIILLTPGSTRKSALSGAAPQFE